MSLSTFLCHNWISYRTGTRWPLIDAAPCTYMFFILLTSIRLKCRTMSAPRCLNANGQPLLYVLLVMFDAFSFTQNFAIRRRFFLICPPAWRKMDAFNISHESLSSLRDAATIDESLSFLHRMNELSNKTCQKFMTFRSLVYKS